MGTLLETLVTLLFLGVLLGIPILVLWGLLKLARSGIVIRKAAKIGFWFGLLAGIGSTVWLINEAIGQPADGLLPLSWILLMIIIAIPAWLIGWGISYLILAVRARGRGEPINMVKVIVISLVLIAVGPIIWHIGK